MTDEPDDTETTHPAPSREAFLEWRSPRSGHGNPEVMTNPVWEWLIKTRLSGSQANQAMEGPSAFDAGPCWSFQRYGTSVTSLPDGREIHIAGEHEDHYDPDFHIYNDVVIKHPDGCIEVLGYAEAAFPATDFHSATLVDQEIIVLGNLGWFGQRRPGVTPVFALNVGSLCFREVPTHGTYPGWIHKHRAVLSDDRSHIVISGGSVDTGNEETRFVENVDDWSLDLRSGLWTRLTKRTWNRARVQREDRKMLQLWSIRSASYMREARMNPMIAELLPTSEEPEAQPDFELFGQLFLPPVDLKAVNRESDEEDEYGVLRIEVEGTVVRYNEVSESVTITAEGELSASTFATMVEDLRSKLERLEHSPCVATPLPAL